MNKNVTIVISCAGMGTRLGLGCTKALVEIEGKTLIERQLEILKEYDDIRIVVGYQAEKVIELVNSVRKDILFVFNHEYRSTGTGASFSLGAEHGREYVVALDGDLIVHPEDLLTVMGYPGSCVCGTAPSSDDPWLMKTNVVNGKEMVEGFFKDCGEYEWTGLAKVRTSDLKPGTRHVFHMIEPLLPLPLQFVRTREIDTIEDYDRAVAWIQSGYSDTCVKESM